MDVLGDNFPEKRNFFSGTNPSAGIFSINNIFNSAGYPKIRREAL
jgi:hypothetical protein